MTETRPSVFTIGHSNHSIESFIGLLQRHGIEVVADTRSQPHSRYSPQFNHNELRETLAARGIGYWFLGGELGGRPESPGYYDDKGYVLYGRLAQSPKFRAGLDMLKERLVGERVALLCSEENPSICHRRLLIGRVLYEEGVSVRHIRGDGRLETEEAIRKDEDQARQPALFALDEDEDSEWKSIRSVLPKAQPPASSES